MNFRYLPHLLCNAKKNHDQSLSFSIHESTYARNKTAEKIVSFETRAHSSTNAFQRIGKCTC